MKHLMKYSIHLVGYKKLDPVGNLEDKVVVRLVDTKVSNALARAEVLVKRDNWLVAEVIELEEQDEFNN